MAKARIAAYFLVLMSEIRLMMSRPRKAPTEKMT